MNCWHQYEVLFKPMHSSHWITIKQISKETEKTGKLEIVTGIDAFFSSLLTALHQKSVKMRKNKPDRMFARVGVRLPRTALIFLLRTAFTPHHSCTSPPRNSLHQILRRQTTLIAGCWKFKLHPSISILPPSHCESFCHICFILLIISPFVRAISYPHTGYSFLANSATRLFLEASGVQEIEKHNFTILLSLSHGSCCSHSQNSEFLYIYIYFQQCNA